MEEITVLIARAAAWIESIELNPRGKFLATNLAQALVNRYGFMVYPTKLEEFDESKGIIFKAGHDGDTTIEQLIIYTHGIILETRDSTQKSQDILTGAFEWASQEFGIAYNPKKIRSWQYYSQLVFKSHIELIEVHPAIRNLSEGIINAVQQDLGERISYEPVSVVINHDPLTRKNPYGSFSIQRRDNLPFSEWKYFSDAPVPTDIHIELLEKFESDLAKG